MDGWMDGWMDGGGMGWKLWPWPWAAPWIAKSKERWMDGWMDGYGMGWPWAAPWIRLQKHLLGHGCETAEPHQDSGPRGGPLVCGPGAVSAPSNQLKAKRDGWMDGWMDGWGWNGVEALAVALSSTVDSAAPPRARLRNSRTPAGFRPKGWPIGLRTRGRFSAFEPARSKEMDGWVVVEALALDGLMGWRNGLMCWSITALSSTVDSAAERAPSKPP